MKTKISSLLAVILLGGILTSYCASTNEVPGGTEIVSNPIAPSAPPWYGTFTNLFDTVVMSSNTTYAVFGAVFTSGEKQGKPLGGVLAAYNWTQYFGTGLGIYASGGGWSMVNAQVQLLLPIQITPNFMLEPFTFGGIGTSLSGAGQANGGPSMITEFGVNTAFAKSGNWDFGLAMFYGTITGAGPYSGGDAGASVTFSHGMAGSGFLGLFGRNSYEQPTDDARWTAEDLAIR